MVKLLIGGSPCTHWSIAQKNNRETTASGIGWELFKNYLIAREKFQPDYFLYENNKSAAQEIKDAIKESLGAWDGTFFMADTGVRYIEINSALVSAQNRQRFYVHNCGDVGQPADRGILLKDILETGESWNENSYTLDANYCKTGGTYNPKSQHSYSRHMAAEPVCVAERGRYSDTGTRSAKSDGTVEQHIEPRTDGKTNALTTVQKDNAVCEPIDYQPRVGSKVCITDNSIRCVQDDGKGPTCAESMCYFEDVKVGTLTTAHKPMVCEPVCMRYERTEHAKQIRKDYENGTVDVGMSELRYLQPREDGKSNTLTTVLKDNPICEPVRIGTIESGAKNMEQDSKQYRVYSPDAKATTQCGSPGSMGKMTGLYAVPVNETKSTGSMVTSSCATCKVEPAQAGKKVYTVSDGQIEIKGKKYPIKLADGQYIIRKLTVTECCRLQTMPDDYCRAVSATQAYKGLGNGWTAEVVRHILWNALKDVPKDEKIVVCSMYDGIATGRYILDIMGFTNVEYHAYEIDKYAIQIAMSNYPDIIQHGDAFQVRDEDWNIQSV